MRPTGDHEPEASKSTVSLFGVEVNRAIGAWSGVMAMPVSGVEGVRFRSVGAAPEPERSKKATREDPKSVI